MKLDEYCERRTSSVKQGTLGGQKVTCALKVDRKLLNVEGDWGKRAMGRKRKERNKLNKILFEKCQN